MMFVFTPLLLNALRHSLALGSERQVALIGSADASGMFVGAIAAMLTVPTRDRRMLAVVGLGMLVLADLGSLAASDFGVLQYLCRVAAGAGAGFAMGVSYAAFAAAAQPERSFALFGMLQTAIGSAAILCLAPLMPRHGPAALYCASLLFGVSGLALTWLIDRRPPLASLAAVAAEQAGRRHRAISVTWLGPLTGITFFGFGLTANAIWANIESIGTAFGLSNIDASDALSFSLIGSVAGSLLVIVTGNRWGRLLPSGLIAVAYLAGIALLLAPNGVGGFLVAVTAFQFGTNMGSHCFGAISEADPIGRLSIIYLLSLKAGFAAGPLAASWALRGNGYQGLVETCLVAAFLVCALLCTTLVTAVRATKFPPRLDSYPPVVPRSR